MKIYVVTMYRHGDREGHSYVLCAREKKARALRDAEDEEIYRGGKYVAEVIETDTKIADIHRGKYKVVKRVQLADWITEGRSNA